jgi:transposase
LAADPEALICYADEMDLDWNPRTTRVWARKGHAPRQMTPGKNEKRIIFGALAPGGRFFYSVKDRKRSACFIEFLRRLLTRVARPAQRVLVILDSYGTHTAHIVSDFVATTHDRLRLAFLPEYCPNDNPVERVWSLLHRAVLHNAYHDSLAAREQVARRHLAHLQRTGVLNFVHV